MNSEIYSTSTNRFRAERTHIIREQVWVWRSARKSSRRTGDVSGRKAKRAGERFLFFPFRWPGPLIPTRPNRSPCASELPLVAAPDLFVVDQTGIRPCFFGGRSSVFCRNTPRH